MGLEEDERLNAFENAIRAIEQGLQPVLEEASVGSADGGDVDTRLREAEVHVALAYTLNSLFYMFLRTQGVDASQHPVREEIDRVKIAYAKLQRVRRETREMTRGEAGDSEDEDEDEDDGVDRGKQVQENVSKRTKVDTAAAGRFITASMDVSQAKKRDKKRQNKSDGAKTKEKSRLRKRKE
mmetsp:Transcript_10302/g.20758  ORF Transcript_10302/g.20758 Transcript_10302/m.20758 type:complete len:182 (+) Transcript_10302:94-639(+)